MFVFVYFTSEFVHYNGFLQERSIFNTVLPACPSALTVKQQPFGRRLAFSAANAGRIRPASMPENAAIPHDEGKRISGRNSGENVAGKQTRGKETAVYFRYIFQLRKRQKNEVPAVGFGRHLADAFSKLFVLKNGTELLHYLITNFTLFPAEAAT